MTTNHNITILEIARFGDNYAVIGFRGQERGPVLDSGLSLSSAVDQAEYLSNLIGVPFRFSPDTSYNAYPQLVAV